MSKFSLLRSLPLLALAGALVTTAPVTAQSRRSSNQDIGQQIEQEYGVVDDRTREGQQLNDQLDEIVGRITSAITRQRENRNFQLRSAKILGGRSEKHNQVINAFALPDGRIYVTLGLMRAVGNSARADDEIAFVVGHEITHVTEQHSANQQKKAMGAGLLAAVLGAVTRNRTIGTAGQYGAAAYVSSFGRKDEYSADAGGLKAMHRAGYDLNGAVSMLKRLGAKGGSQNRVVNGWFGSHPLTENRVARVQEMIQDLQSGRGIRDRSEKDLERDDRAGRSGRESRQLRRNR